jgi:hypothetical protein
MRRVLAALAAGVTLLLAAAPAQAVAVPYIRSFTVHGPYLDVTWSGGYQHTYLTCKTESDVGCWWNAALTGNGDGYSFVRVHRDGSTCVAYLNATYAETHNFCS